MKKNLKTIIQQELKTLNLKSDFPFWNDGNSLDKIVSIIESIPNLSDKKRFYKRIKPNTHELYRDNYYKFCLEKIDKSLGEKGMWIEMGVFKGQTITLMNKFKKQIFPNSEEPFYGFDSFKGLPEDWKKNSPKGKFKLEKIPKIEGCEMVVGWFDDTLPNFVNNHKNKKLALLHIDCDLYSSTKTTLEHLDQFITEGTVILLDEVIGSEDHIKHEYKAFKEYLEKNNIEIEWLAYMANAAQAACKIIKK